MTEQERLKLKIKQYAYIKEMRDSLNGRLEELSKDIKTKLAEGKHQFDELEVTIQIKDRTALNESAFWDHFGQKANQYVKEVPDPDLIEQAYLNGEISDGDLRQIREPKYSTALVVKKSVQSDS